MERIRQNQKPKRKPRQDQKGKHREKAFALAYIKDPNATRAAIAVGLSPKGAHTEGCKLLKKPYVADLLQKHRQRLEDRTQVTVERLLAELGKVAFASMADYFTVDDEGQPQLDMSQLAPEQWAAIGEITTEVYWDGPKDQQREVKRTKFKLHDKLGAIDKALRHLGGYSKGGGGEGEGEGQQTTVYTLNIGSANILVRPDNQAAPNVIEGMAR